MANSLKLDNIPSPENIELTPELERKVLFSLLEDISNEKERMIQQAKVNFSLLEDVADAQKKLKKQYRELDVLKNLVQELGLSLKTAVVMEKLIAALKEILPPSVNFAYVIPSSDPGRPSKLIYIHAGESVGKAYLDSVKDNLTLGFDLVPTRVKNRGALTKWIRGDLLFEFVEGTIDKTSKNLPLSFFNVPLLIKDDLLGIANLSSPEPNLFTKEELNLIHTMVGVTTNTISRLQQLLASEGSRIEALVKSMTNGIIMFDLDQRVNLANPAAQKMTGLPGKGFYLSEFIKLFQPAAADIDLEKKIAKTLEKGESIHIEELNLPRFTYELFATPVLDYEKNIIGGAIILHDITHIKEIDRMKTEFVSVASHQLRTPLTPLRLFSEMLLNGEVGKLNPKQKEYIEAISQSTQRMIKLVNDLLNVSRIETGRLKIEPKLIQIEDFIQSIIDEAVPVANSHRCRFIFNKPKIKLPKIPIDPTLVRQVIHNLITNAIRYSSKKQCDIVVTLARKSHDYIISVKDNGIGIPENIQSRIFEKFFRADNAQKAEADGSGLGLYVAKMIIEASGGEIWFESPPKSEKRGTIFYVSIPAKGMMKKEGEKGLVG